MTLTEPARPPSIVGPISAVLAIAGALMYLWYGWCIFPLSEWNEMRLAPAFALRYGYPIYPLEGGGPLSTWIYGPIGVFLNLPATWACSAVSAVEAAGVLNVFTLVLPLSILCFSANELATSTRVLALAFSILLLPANALAFQVADHSAVAFGLISCWWLVRSIGGSGSPKIALAALCCIVSVSSKQTSVFLPFAQLAFLWYERDVGRIRRYVGWLLALGAVVAVGVVVSFGFENLWLNLVRIPGHLPWGDFSEKIDLRYPQLLAYIIAPSALLAARKYFGLAGQRHTETERFLRCVSFSFIILLPVGLLSFFKIGGDTNVFHSWFYVMPALVVATVSKANRQRSATVWHLLISACLLAARVPELSRLPPRPLTAHLERAQQIAAMHVGAVWFPNNPVITFYSDKALYHVEDGIRTRHLAGLSIKERQFREHLPYPLNAVVYSSMVQDPFALQLLPEFNQRRVKEDWAIFFREVDPR